MDPVAQELTQVGEWITEGTHIPVEHGHQAAISIHNYCQGIPVTERPAPGLNLVSQKMGLGQWSYSNDYNPAGRQKKQHVDLERRFQDMNLEVELGFTAAQTAREV